MSREEVTPAAAEVIQTEPQETEVPAQESGSVETEQQPEAVETAEEEQSESPDVTPALAAEGGREVSSKILYVGGLTKALTEDDVRDIFSVSGAVQSVKILFDKNRPGFNYAFVEFEQEDNAKTAFDSLNGEVINGSEFRINWAYQSQQAKSNPEAFNIFVGDLSSEVNDEKLRAAFTQFPSLLQAHVMWDMQSGRSRGYGFVSFDAREEADEAIRTMNGEIICGRAIRLNWASHKQMNNNNGGHGHHGHHHHHHNGNGMGMNNGYHYNKFNNNNHYNNGNHHHNNGNNGFNNGNGANAMNYQQNNMLNNGSNGSPVIQGSPIGNGIPLNGGSGPMMSPPNFEAVLRKSPNWQTTVYLGNLAHFTTQNDLIPLLQNFGFIVDLKFYPERGCAFVKYDSHERAALAIVQLTGLVVNGRALKLGWGKERIPGSVPYQNYPIVYGQ